MALLLEHFFKETELDIQTYTLNKLRIAHFVLIVGVSLRNFISTINMQRKHQKKVSNCKKLYLQNVPSSVQTLDHIKKLHAPELN